MYLMTNEVLEFVENQEKIYERILWISPNDYCYTIQLKTTKILLYRRSIENLENSIDDGVVNLVNNNIEIRLDAIDNTKQKYKERVKKAYDIIKFILQNVSEPYVYERRYRGQIIKEASKKYCISSTVIYKYLRLYWQGGMTKDSLLPYFYKCGGKGKERKYTRKPGRPNNNFYITGKNEGIIIDESMEKIFSNATALVYENPKERHLTEAYKWIKNNYLTELTDGVRKIKDISKIPTFRQFQYWCFKNEDPIKKQKKRKGDKYYNLNYRALPSNSTYESFYPGFRVQVDSTVADIYLVSSIDRTSIIGRPVVYFAIDTFSRYILGVHIALEGPSWDGVSSLIFNMNENKVEFCKRYGIEIDEEDWLTIGIPRVLLADRGEMVGPESEKIVENLRIIIENAATGRGDAKGIVEQNFNVINTRIKHWLPGAVKRQYRERGERDYKLDAKLTTEEFTKIIIYLILDRNKRIMEKYPLTPQMVNDKVNPTPLDICKWGLKNGTGSLFKYSENYLKINLMRKKYASITEHGLKFKGAEYLTPFALKQNWLSLARIKGIRKVQIVYDSRNMSTIYIVDSNFSSDIIPCQIKAENSIFLNKTFEEIIDYQFIQKANYFLLENQKNNNDLKVHDDINSVLDEAEKKSKHVNFYDKSRAKNIKENRKNEPYREQQAFIVDIPNISQYKELDKNKIENASNIREIEMLRKRRRRNHD